VNRAKSNATIPKRKNDPKIHAATMLCLVGMLKSANGRLIERSSPNAAAAILRFQCSLQFSTVKIFTGQTPFGLWNQGIKEILSMSILSVLKSFEYRPILRVKK
jgi:hypothetical protein